MSSTVSGAGGATTTTPSTPTLGQTLDNLALANDLIDLQKDLAANTAAAISAIGAPLLDKILTDIAADEFNGPTGGGAGVVDFTQVNLATGALLAKAGTVIDAGTIGQVTDKYAFDDNLGGVEAVLKNISNATAIAIGNDKLDAILKDVVQHEAFEATATNQAINDLMVKAGAAIDGNAIGQAFVALNNNGYYVQPTDFGGYEAILHNLSAPTASQVPAYFLDLALAGLTSHNNTDQASVNQTTGDFLAKEGAYVDAIYIAETLETFANTGNLAGVEAVLHNITAAKLASVDATGTDNNLETVLYDIAQNAQTGNFAATNQATADFLAKVGNLVDPGALGQTLDTFARLDLGGVEAILHNVSASTIAKINGYQLGLVLEDLSRQENTITGGLTATNQATTDLLAAGGTVIDPGAVAQTLGFYAGTGNLAGVEAILHSPVPAAAYAAIGSQELGFILQNIAQNETANLNGTNQAVYDFVLKAGATIDSTVLGQTLDLFARTDDLGGVHAILHNTNGATITKIGGAELGLVLQDIATHSHPSEVATANQATADLLTRAASVIDPKVIGAVLDFDANGNPAGVETILHNISATTALQIGAVELNQILKDVASNAFFDPVNTNQALGDLLAKAQTVIDPTVLGQVLSGLTQGTQYNPHADFGGIEAILHNISATTASHIAPLWLDQILAGITNHQNDDLAGTNQTTGDFLAKESAYMDLTQIIQTTETFSRTGNLAGVEAVLHNVSSVAISHITPQQLPGITQGVDQILNNIVQHVDPANPGLAFQTTTDLLNLAGGVIDKGALGQAANYYAAHSYDAGVEAIINHVADATAQSLSQSGFFGANLYGGNGNDVLTSHGFAENMYGGSGADTFIAVHALTPAAGITIHDFSTTDDRLDLSKLISGTHPTDATIANFIQATQVNGNTVVTVDGTGVPGHATDTLVLTGVTSFNVHDLYHTGHIVA